MAKVKPLTKDDLLEVLAQFYSGQIKPDLKGLDQKIDTVGERMGAVELELRGVKNEIEGLKAELSGTATKAELNKLKTRVNRLHPTN